MTRKMAVLSVAAIMVSTVYPQKTFRVEPTMVDFETVLNVPYKIFRTVQIRLEDHVDIPHEDCTIKLTEGTPKWEKTPAAPFGFHVPQMTVPASGMILVNLWIDPAVQGPFPRNFSNKLRLGVGMDCADALEVSEIPVKARVSNVCDRGNCDPNGPQCVVDTNSYPIAFAQIPDLADRLKPALLMHHQAHFPAPSNYRLPLTFLWEVSGLDKIVSKPNPGCCEADINFQRVSKTERLATFTWNGSPDSLHGEVISGGVKVEVDVDVPSSLGGFTIVHGLFSEFHYTPTAAPTLRVSTTEAGNTVVLFEGEISCSNSALGYVTIRNRNFDPSKVQPPNLNFLISEKEISP